MAVTHTTAMLATPPVNASKQDLEAMGFKVTVLKPRKARKNELIMSRIKARGKR